jgi:hypothetical protein
MAASGVPGVDDDTSPPPPRALPALWYKRPQDLQARVDTAAQLSYRAQIPYKAGAAEFCPECVFGAPEGQCIDPDCPSNKMGTAGVQCCSCANQAASALAKLMYCPWRDMSCSVLCLLRNQKMALGSAHPMTPPPAPANFDPDSEPFRTVCTVVKQGVAECPLDGSQIILPLQAPPDNTCIAIADCSFFAPGRPSVTARKIFHEPDLVQSWMGAAALWRDRTGRLWEAVMADFFFTNGIKGSARCALVSDLPPTAAAHPLLQSNFQRSCFARVWLSPEQAAAAIAWRQSVSEEQLAELRATPSPVFVKDKLPAEEEALLSAVFSGFTSWGPNLVSTDVPMDLSSCPAHLDAAFFIQLLVSSVSCSVKHAGLAADSHTAWSGRGGMKRRLRFQSLPPYRVGVAVISKSGARGTQFAMPRALAAVAPSLATLIQHDCGAFVLDISACPPEDVHPAPILGCSFALPPGAIDFSSKLGWTATAKCNAAPVHQAPTKGGSPQFYGTSARQGATADVDRQGDATMTATLELSDDPGRVASGASLSPARTAVTSGVLTPGAAALTATATFAPIAAWLAEISEALHQYVPMFLSASMTGAHDLAGTDPVVLAALFDTWSVPTQLQGAILLKAAFFDTKAEVAAFLAANGRTGASPVSPTAELRTLRSD